jgi:23S rRNA (cytidine1920-2'-O)/16S rRNA (cytidine1409-2'-O)-methyltransferase
MIAEGLVSLLGKPLLKPGLKIAEDSLVEVSKPEKRFASRGGFKLDGAMERFCQSVDGLVCADIGASTGGFTDCLLQRGALKVYAVDNGHGQLDPSLLKDPRVISIEGVNARRLTWEDLGEKCSFCAVDLSFISLSLVLGAIAGILNPGGRALILVKPEFEAGREAIGKGGVVKSAKARAEALAKTLDCAKGAGFEVLGTMESPVKGGDGNIEYFAYLKLE